MTKHDFIHFTARLRDYFRECPAAASPTEGACPAQDKFGELALELFQLQYGGNGAYRRFCEARGLAPEDVAHWSQIPAIPTVAFKELDLTVVPAPERVRVFHSSGTTEHRPSRHFHSRESLALYQESIRPWFTRHLLPEIDEDQGEFRDRAENSFPRALAVLTPSCQDAPHSSLVEMFETIRRDGKWEAVEFFGRISPADGWHLDARATWSFLQKAAKEGLSVLVSGTAFSFVHLLDFLETEGRGLALPDGSRVLETGGYKGRSRALPKAELHARIEERLGVPRPRIVCEYGMSELSSQAYDRVCGLHTSVEPARRFRFPPWARAQVISPETNSEVGEGQAGLIRVFDLANVSSVIAIQTEDLAVRRGDAFELHGRRELAQPRGCSLMAV